LEQLHQLTNAQRLDARDKARAHVIRVFGERPTRDTFADHTVSDFPHWLTLTVARHLVKFGHFPIGHALLMADLDANRQRIALRVYNASEGIPAHRFKEVVDELLAEQQQEALFDLEALLIQSVQAADNTPLVRKGHRARTGAPAGKDLPPVRWMMRDSIAHVMERYIKDLLKVGEDRAAGALGNVYNTLIGHNWMAVPADSILPKHGGPTAAELCHDIRMD